MSRRKRLLLLPALIAALLGAAGATARADSLGNLERERAILMDALLTPEISPEQRQKKVELSRNRLVDLERMVLRDKTLLGKNTPMVRAAFGDYDLTFLVHASTEHNRALLDHWLDRVGVSTKSLMNTKVGMR